MKMLLHNILYILRYKKCAYLICGLERLRADEEGDLVVVCLEGCERATLEFEAVDEATRVFTSHFHEMIKLGR